MTPPADTPTTFPFYSIAGDPSELGRQYGEAAREAIHAYLDGIVERFAGRSTLSADEVRRRLGVFAGDYERYAPHVLEEIRGVAAGAGVTAEESLLCRTRWDIHNLPSGCTSFAAQPEITAPGQMIAGQNKDVAPGRVDEVVIVRAEPAGRPAFIGYSYAGMMEGPGFNSAGLCRFENSIYVKGHGRAIPVHLLKRLLTECTCIDACINVLERLRADGMLGLVAAMALGDASGRAVSIEIVPGDFRVIEAVDGLIARANNVLAPDLQHLDQAGENDRWRDTFARTARIRALLTGEEPLTVERCCAALSDHEGHPGSICRHHEHASTVASIVCVPAAGELHVSRGNPCENAFTCYRL